MRRETDYFCHPASGFDDDLWKTMLRVITTISTTILLTTFCALTENRLLGRGEIEFNLINHLLVREFF